MSSGVSLMDGPGREIVAALLRLSAIPKDDWEDALQEILRIDAEVLGLARVSYWALWHDPLLLRCEMGYVTAAHAFERGAVLLADEHPHYFEALAQAVVMELEDVERDPRTAEMRDYLSARNISSMLDVPTWTHGQVIGVLCHEHTGAPRSWTASELDFAVAVAQSISAAVEARARGRAEEQERQAVFLDQATRRLTDGCEWKVVADTAMAIAVPELADWAVLDMLGEDRIDRMGQAHRDPARAPLLEELRRRFPPKRTGPHITARVMQLRQSVLLPDVSSDLLRIMLHEDHARLLEAIGTRSAIATPLCVGDRVLGAILLCSYTRGYGQNDLRLADEFARRVTWALDNARLHGEARAAISARDEFIALAAHELHGPLASLQLAAESLAARATSSPPEAVKRMSETVVHQTRRMSRLVNHMLDASRVMAKRLSIAPERMDLVALVRELARSYAERFEQAGCALELDTDPALIGCWDGDRLAQVIGNLLDNALKFGRGKPIALSARRDGDHAVLRVRDRGTGIAPDRLGLIFEPFERANAPRGLGGLGLGLFTAKAIVDAHGGEIGVESRPNEGACLTVRLPLQPPELPANA